MCQETTSCPVGYSGHFIPVRDKTEIGFQHTLSFLCYSNTFHPVVLGRLGVTICGGVVGGRDLRVGRRWTFIERRVDLRALRVSVLFLRRHSNVSLMFFFFLVGISGGGGCRCS